MRRPSPMRVLHVLTVPESLLFLRGQPRFLRERFDITLDVVCSPGPEVVPFKETEGAQVLTLPVARRIDVGTDLRCVRMLRTVIAKGAYDIVHGSTPKGGLLSMIAATPSRRAGMRPRKLIYQARGLPYSTLTGPRRLLMRGTETVSCRLADRVLCNSESVRARLVADGIVASAKTTVLGLGSGNGVDVDRFHRERHRDAGAAIRAGKLSGSQMVIGYVGRLTRDKGVDELREAWSQIRNRIPGARLLIIGGQDARSPLAEDLVRRLDAEPGIVRTGAISDPAPYYAAMDILVLPSYREGLPNVLLEAGAMSLPIVTTDTDGCRNAVLPGVSARLVPARDAAALGAAIAAYATDANLRNEHGTAARAFVCANFDRSKVHQGLGEFYRAVLSNDAVPE